MPATHDAWHLSIHYTHSALELGLEDMISDFPWSAESRTLRNVTVSDKLDCLITNMSLGYL